MKKQFIIGSNLLIFASRFIYRRDTFPKFWEWLLKGIINKDIIIPECVYKQLIVNNRKLSKWSIDHISEHVYNDKSNPNVWSDFSKVMQYVNSGIYSKDSKRDWNINTVTPRLLAIAMAHHYIIITNSTKTGQFVDGKLKDHRRPATGEPRIPDISPHFHVMCENLYDFEQNSGIEL